MDKKRERLIIVMPAYNEEENIASVVADWHPIVEAVGNGSCLLVIDDGSRDATSVKLVKLQKEYTCLSVISKENQGHGATVYRGYQEAIDRGADYIFQTDSDGQTIPSEFWDLWEKRRTGGLLIGKRLHRQDGKDRIVVTHVLRLVLRMIFGCRIQDANTPFRLMKACELRRILRYIPKNHSLTNVLVTVLYTKLDYPVTYFPITFRPRQGGKNSVDMKKIVKLGMEAVKDFWKLRKRYHKKVL